MALTLQPSSAALRAAAGGCARYPRGSYAAGEPPPTTTRTPHARTLSLWEDASFDQEERDYKLVAAQKLREARTALLSGGDWLTSLKTALGGSNNLLNWRARGTFLDWCAAEPEVAIDALRGLWETDEAKPSTIDRFADAVTSDSTPGNKLVIASVLLLGLDPTAYPPFRPTVDEKARSLLGLTQRARSIDTASAASYEPASLAARLGVSLRFVRDYADRTFGTHVEEQGTNSTLSAEQARALIAYLQPTARSTAPGERYSAFRDLIDEFVEQMRSHGFVLRDQLDGQGLVWWVTSSNPPGHWPEEEQAAFLAFQQRGGTGLDAHDASLIAPVTEVMAKKVHLPRPWLQEAVDLLVEKRQVIFYGPPGTGKTFIARAIGEHIVATGGACQLVQFHPAYSYEDFFEGYRPSTSGDGDGLHFDLQKGPLRRIAEQAAADPGTAYLLVIDEINRGNIAKIFGELYFLLEYRDQPIRLQYSPDVPFQLPENLLLIGTMNTADRPIALVDSALRRRFYFYPFLPREEPVRSVLGTWLVASGHDPEPARLLNALNEALHQALPDDEFAIGPSYFMAKAGPPDLDRVWRYAIRPLLEERFYGSMPSEEINREFGLNAMRLRVAGLDADVAQEQDGGA